ncbi:MAG: 23S rRNA pseudouridine(955/2504/2580) synthase RluC [Methylococcales bacterium]|nr:23S rRNA pseudouridine(955/2504/2580) synthase RluC [Methylococcales bacterium]
MNSEQNPLPTKVVQIEITEENHEQRLDNFLITLLKGVPKTRIYRIVRKGEVRVNKGRVEVNYRLKTGDIVRIPPVRIAERSEEVFVPSNLKEALQHSILYEDDGFLIVNKPAGFAVHGGSGVSSGIIEGLRLLRPEAKFLELVHRLDKDTSGCLVIAKKRSALRAFHAIFRDNQVKKTYVALLSGQWKKKKLVVNAPLLKNIAKGGERMVMVSSAGKEAETVFTRLTAFAESTLVEAAPKTGRTHQIRVHALHLGHPIVGDERYGRDDVNLAFKQKGYKRMFLHAKTLAFSHPLTGVAMKITAPLPQQLELLLAKEAI